ncbi:class I SAM-dependent methyltransferase [Candidatus Acetothermia bacterium]|jgi:ubiquinone/menaquinone biosynthesis C-methylase UbiE|nr:class I SAM-dependent methyltransferase [Candidatus Acetothermia bacterium]MCI2432462.1 class I SAM-dependent methyltransferase [Candidatus Acetothermia bacterium]MCI2437100.1 class I SAM-dependent methyltransferase [Candidatus Acetothermia bacterium]
MIELLRQAGITEGQAVLDIGFGSVEELLAIGALVGKQGSVIGLEKNPEPVRQALASVKEVPTKISILEGLAEQIPLSHESVDLVLCKGVLHEIRDLPKAVSGMVRVLKPHGTLALIDFQPIPKAQFLFYKIIATISQRKICEDRHPGFSREEITELLNPYQMEYRALGEMGRLGWLEVPLFLARATKALADSGLR